MRGLYDFLVEPIGNRYNNNVKVEGGDLVLNSKIETFKSVNNKAKVIEVPLAYKTDIKVGDEVIIHHNVFRRFYDVRGNEKNSRSYISDNKYIVSIDQIYLYKRKNTWKAFMDRCFLAPIINDKDTDINNLKIRKGVLVYGNKELDNLNVNEGDVLNFKNLREFEFVVEKRLLYCMKSNDILINHGCKRHEKEYNPSWANCC